jgi:hypothetical protein
LWPWWVACNAVRRSGDGASVEIISLMGKSFGASGLQPASTQSL